MATSNAIGSNVFDILICLGLPWFLQTAIVSPGSVVRVISKGWTTFSFFKDLNKNHKLIVFWFIAGLTYSTLSLLSTIAFLLGATHLNGWKLDRKYGVALLGWYFFFMLIASMYEVSEDNKIFYYHHLLLLTFLNINFFLHKIFKDEHFWIFQPSRVRFGILKKFRESEKNCYKCRWLL